MNRRQRCWALPVPQRRPGTAATANSSRPRRCGHRMRRRDLLAFTGGLALSLGASRLNAANPPRIGILDPGLPHLFDAFFAGMNDHGYIEGETVAYIRRSTPAE